MPNNRNDSSMEQFRVMGTDGRIPRTRAASSTRAVDDTGLEKRGLNPEVSKITVRPAPPKPIATNQTTPKHPGAGRCGPSRSLPAGPPREPVSPVVALRTD